MHCPTCKSYVKGWWHYPVLAVAIVVLGFVALVVHGFQSDESAIGMSSGEVQKELQFCHDKGMTTAHSSLPDGQIDKVWCLMEPPKFP